MNPTQDRHPSADALLAFAHGRLQATDFATIEEHVRRCEICCAWMAEQEDHTLLHLAREVATEGLLQGSTIDNVEPLALPEVLDDHPRYRVIERIGSGGMGAVYKAEHRLMHRIVALKVVHPRRLLNQQAIERFQREVRMAAKLSHPHIVASYDADQAGGIHFLVMEFVAGVSLEQKVKSTGPVDAGTACDWIRQALLGLKHSHECGMTHRDIKPANLMITPEGQIKILDFGLSRLADDSPPAIHPNQDSASGETQVDVILGTPDYIAPEQIANSRNATIQSDIYGFGCTLYFLLAGKAPFADLPTREKLQAHHHKSLPRIDAIRDDVPATVLSVLDRMTAKSLQDRFADPGQALDELEQLLSPSPRSSLHSDHPTTAPMSTRRHWMKGMGIASTGIALAMTTWAASGFPSIESIVSPRSARMLVMLPKQGLWFPDYQALIVGAENSGVELVFAGLDKESSQTLLTSIPGIAVPDMVISDELQARDYDAIIFIGYDTSDFSPDGPAGEHAKRLINEFQFEKKVTAALCSGQRILAQHGALRGKRVSTSQSVSLDEIRFEGGEQSSESLVVDGKVVTSDATEDATDFLQAIIKIVSL